MTARATAARPQCRDSQGHLLTLLWRWLQAEASG